LTFYRQAADLRGQILQESERISVMRLVLDRLAADLRTAEPAANSGAEFIGGSNSMRFIRESLNVPFSTDSASIRAGKTDLTTISIATLMETNDNKTRISGLGRTEEPVSAAVSASNGIIISNSASFLPGRASQPPEALTDLVRFVRFRYWDGAAWQSGWSNTTPPAGVEIVLATEPAAEDAAPDAYPPGPLRRVIYVPGGAAHRRSSSDLFDNSISVGSKP
jgi:hypothetical protein